jgi:hypothetical protein
MDSELLRCEEVIKKLNERQGRGGTNLEKFRQEIVERFAGIGLGVAVRVYTTNEEGLYAFDIDIDRRLAGQFDPDRQVHEVTNDLLNLGEGGVIKSGGLHLVQGGHGHGGHGHKH